MSSVQPSPDTPPEPDEPQPPTHERWWWTGTYRAVLGAVVVGFQWDALSSGDASVWNWVIGGLGAVVVALGLYTVWTAYRSRRGDGVR